jgi:hypothetical protein
MHGAVKSGALALLLPLNQLFSTCDTRTPSGTIKSSFISVLAALIKRETNEPFATLN